MKTLALFTGSGQAIPAGTSWYLDALAEFRGKQELYTRQSPQKLKVLREHAMIESAVSSNRIEGVAMEAARIPSVLVATKPLFRDRGRRGNPRLSRCAQLASRKSRRNSCQ